MNKLGLILVAALTLCALPASAQRLSVGPDGLRIDSGARHHGDRRYHGRDFRRSRGEYVSKRVIVVPRHHDRRRGRTVIIER